MNSPNPSTPGSEFGAALFGHRGTSQRGEHRGGAGGWLSAFWAALIGRPQIARDATTGTGDIPPAAEPSQTHRLDIQYAPQNVAAHIEARNPEPTLYLTSPISSEFDSTPILPRRFEVSAPLQERIGEAWARLRKMIDGDSPDETAQAVHRFQDLKRDPLSADDKAGESLLYMIARNDHYSATASSILAGLLSDENDTLFTRILLHQMINLEDSKATPSAMLSLGDVERAQGDLLRARHWYQLASSRDSGFAGIYARARLGLSAEPVTRGTQNDSFDNPVQEGTPRQRGRISPNSKDTGSPVSPKDKQR